MKNIKLATFTLLILSIIATICSAEANEEPTSNSVSSSSSSSLKSSESSSVSFPSSSVSSSVLPSSWGLGFATSISLLPGSNASLSGLYNLTSQDTIQGFLVVPAVSPFSLSFAALYKRTIVESKNAGFHIGGGLGLADLANGGPFTGAYFRFTLAAIGGFHFTVPDVPHVAIHLDGGAVFGFQSTVPTESDFQINTLSPALGLSILYIF